MGCRWSRVQISPPRPENTFCGDLTALLLVQPFRQVDTHERGAGHKSASWSDLDATEWGMQFSALNAYPSAVPVPKEIFADVLNAVFADVLHALPLAASITILAQSRWCRGFSSFYNIPSASSSSALWTRVRVLCAARRDAALVQCAARGAERGCASGFGGCSA